MATRKLEKTIDVEAGTLTVGFASGSSMTVKMSDFPEEIVHQLAFHGLSQKATDATAGKDAEASEEHVKAVIEALQAGNWTVRGSGSSGGSVGRVTLLAEAVARLKGITVAEAQAKIADLEDDQKKALQKAPSVQAAILEIKSERLAKSEQEEGSDDALDMVG